MKAECVIVAVTHNAFKETTLDELKEMMNERPVLIDVRGMFNEKEVERKKFYYRRL